MQNVKVGLLLGCETQPFAHVWGWPDNDIRCAQDHRRSIRHEWKGFILIKFGPAPQKKQG